MFARLALSFCFALGLFGSVSAASLAEKQNAIELGRALAKTHCAACHAIGTRGVSPNPQAPRFRNIGERYPIDNLAEAFSEGILVGHGPMPEFQFEPDQIDGLIAYLKSVQSPAKKGKKRAPK